MNTKLLVTIDTEENWQGPGSNKRPDVGNIYKLPGLQKDCFDNFNIRPVYLVAYPVVLDRKCVILLKDIYESGRCEIGAHLHHWDVPPYTEKDILEKSIQCKLPYDLEKRKIADLTEMIQKEFGTRPMTFRAGRWGADGDTIKILAELGYKIDLSVTPLTDYRDEGGENFYGAPFTAYFPSYKDIIIPSEMDDRIVLEIPVTCGFNRLDFERMRSFYKYVKKAPKSLHLTGFLYELNILKKIKLSPESATFLEMKKLVDVCLNRGQEILHLTFHSSMNSVGDSPYSRVQEERDGRIKNLHDILDYVVNKKGIMSYTAKDIYEYQK